MNLTIKELERIRQGLYAEIELRKIATKRTYDDVLVTNENAKIMEDVDNGVIADCEKLIKRISKRISYQWDQQDKKLAKEEKEFLTDPAWKNVGRGEI